MSTETVYVCGHRNPDTDAIVAAIGYAALRNALGDNGYTAARLGHVSDETSFILKRFGFAPPMRLTTVRTQVRDLDFDHPPLLNKAMPKAEEKLDVEALVNEAVEGTEMVIVEG